MPNNLDTKLVSGMQNAGQAMGDNPDLTGQITGLTTKAIYSALDPNARSARAARRSMRLRLDRGAGALGLDRGQRMAMSEDAIRAAQAAQAPTVDEIQRAGAAKGGGLGSGAAQQAVNTATLQAAAQGGEAASQANVESQRLAEANYNRYYDIINNQAIRGADQAQEAGYVTGKAVSTVIRSYAGGGLDPASAQQLMGVAGGVA